jgi:hypothetical protein
MRMLALPAAAMILAGCSTYSAPELHVLRAAVTDETPEGLVVGFTIEATNRNEIELPLREVRYTLRLDGREVFSGVRSPEASLRRLGTQTIRIPAVIAVGPESPRPTGTLPFTIDGTLGYITPGQFAQVLFDIKVRRPSVAFTGQGTLDLTQAPKTLGDAR